MGGVVSMEARHLHGFVLQVFIVMQFRQNWTRDNDTQLIHAETTGGAGPSQPGGVGGGGWGGRTTQARRHQQQATSYNASSKLTLNVKGCCGRKDATKLLAYTLISRKCTATDG